MDKKKSQPTLISEILSSFLTSYLKKSDIGFEMQLWQDWSQFATTELLKKTRPVSLQKGRLVLWVGNSVAIQELTFHIEDLKNKINTHFKKDLVKEIYFTVNQDLLKKREQSAKLFNSQK